MGHKRNKKKRKKEERRQKKHKPLRKYFTLHAPLGTRLVGLTGSGWPSVYEEELLDNG